jgi:hypothetical protein
MSQPTNDAGRDRPLQFDAAEPTGASDPLACTACAAAIRGYYHEVNGAVVCSACRRAIEQRTRGGSRIGRFARAMTFGAGAAIVGAALYFGIVAYTGYQFGLIAILVGWMVGRAVSAGARGRGGWRYQTLAIALTYSAIVVTYMPNAILRSMGIDPRVATDSLVAAKLASDSAEAEREPRAATPAVMALATPLDSVDAGETGGTAAEVPVAVAIVVGTFVIFLAAAAEPFRQGPEHIMALVIIAIALYNAWLQNKPAMTTITGPYAIGAARSPGTP